MEVGEIEREVEVGERERGGGRGEREGGGRGERDYSTTTLVIYIEDNPVHWG